MTRQLLILISALVATLAFGPNELLAQTRPPATPETPASPSSAPAIVQPNAPIDSSYELGAGDVLDINLVGRPEFGSRARISADGTILLPMIGVIPVSGRTVTDLADQIRQALIKGQFYADPVVRVEVASITSRYVTILGAVGAAGLMPLDKNYHLSEMLAKIGGRSSGGADYVLLTHAAGGTPERYYIAKLALAGPDQDPIVKAGDKIFIPSADSEVFFISGQIAKPGSYPLTEGMTIRKALAGAGGVTENGSENKFKLVRDGKPLKPVKLDDPIKPGDIITFGEKLF